MKLGVVRLYSKTALYIGIYLSFRGSSAFKQSKNHLIV